MPVSMTGFGRESVETPIGQLTVEIQSVNRKFLDVSVSMPRELARFEWEVRKWVGEKVTRGLVSVRIMLIPNMQAVQDLLPDVQLLKGVKQQWDAIAKTLGTGPVDLPFIMQYLPITSKGDLGSDSYLSLLRKSVNHALDKLSAMKKVEGKNLAKDLEERLNSISKMVDTIATASPHASEKMRQKLTEKMEQLLQPSPELEDRLVREIALFAERVDITEEITRLRSHISQFRQLLKEEISGRKMDFLLQELGREANTIASKSLEASISHIVVDLKSELEKMKEQVQNLE